MKIIEVHNQELATAFIQLALQFYKNDDQYIRPLDSDIEEVFDPARNNSFERGECTRWVMQDDRGKWIGRIAAFYTRDASENFEQPTGGCGFFECIDDLKAARLLFDTAKDWLASKGMEAMDGPINFGERHKWWGLLTDGFHQPCYTCNYNPRYYQRLFEDYGFQLYYKQYTYWRKVNDPLDTRYAERARRVLADRGYTFSHVSKSDLEKAASDFRIVYNKAWARHAGIGEMSEEQAQNLLKSMRPILDPRLLWFAYYQGEPVAFWISVPDLNQMIVKKLNGKLTWWGKMLFVWRKMTNKCRTMFGVIFGVVPEHQRRGLEIALIVESARLVQRKDVPYEELQMNWIGDFNPKMMRVADQIGARIYKTHFTYRYLFDREKEFQRHPIL
jgi:hypothetical protein